MAGGYRGSRNIPSYLPVTAWRLAGDLAWDPNIPMVFPYTPVRLGCSENLDSYGLQGWREQGGAQIAGQWRGLLRRLLARRTRIATATRTIGLLGPRNVMELPSPFPGGIRRTHVCQPGCGRRPRLRNCEHVEHASGLSVVGPSARRRKSGARMSRPWCYRGGR